jgi:hypothetical protein
MPMRGDLVMVVNAFTADTLVISLRNLSMSSLNTCNSSSSSDDIWLISKLASW